jgi:Flp pilus assembly protein TadD
MKNTVGTQSHTANGATILAKLLSTQEAIDAEQEALPVLAAALDAHGDNVELLLAMAVLNITRKNNEEAITLLRRILTLEPNHALALNNLATLLAEDPASQSEAVTLVKRALSVTGRQPFLLDTLGTIYFHLGDYASAVANLEEATASGVGDRRYFLHLAAAYQRAGRNDEAKSAFMEVIKPPGIQAAILTPGDRELMNSLTRQYQAAGSSPSTPSTRTEGTAA